MTREQAYEKLELPVGTDLQVVRQKFQQMHNDFQVQIDGAFNEAMRKRKEQQLEELKEAYAVLNESKSMDDSASLPRTEKTFDQTGNETKTQTSQQHAPKEQQQAPPPPPPRQEKEQPQEHAPPVYNTSSEKKKSNTGLLLGIAAGVAAILGIAYFINNRSEVVENPTTTTAVARQDSMMWQSTLVDNNEAIYQHYLDQYPDGIFAQAAKDSLARINERAIAKAAELSKKAQQQADEEAARRLTQQQKRILDNQTSAPNQPKKTVRSINPNRYRDHKVYFSNQDGFSGYLEFRTVYKALGTMIQGGLINLVITGYNTTSSNIAQIKSNGIPLEITGANYSPDKYHVTIHGEATINSSDLSKTFYSSPLKLQCSESTGDFTTVEFKEWESIVQEIKEFGHQHKASLWEKTGNFHNIKITKVDLTDLKDKINNILN
ncbi:hypothetical protein [Sphingobacterium sp. FBM7-1]|uniref:hypothetical protein n=1 Tax=Sphingobacterium sp. FBM7-1 TaxID=2886688 RepID=UPI001D1018A5|nr:hypothetical protein [Sphingobacterium sp. FBM7-1]MCC2599665.1 hypothetical protein [Sphingobacterium sp. FBM7-1]